MDGVGLHPHTLVMDIVNGTESLVPAVNQALDCSACSLVTTVTELSQPPQFVKNTC